MYLGSQLWGQNTCCTKFQLPLIISGPQCQTCKKHKKVDLYATIPALMFSLLREGFVRDPLFSECSPSKPEVTQWFSNGSEPQNHLEGLSNTGPALLLQQDKGAVRICISNNSWVLLLYGPAPLRSEDETNSEVVWSKLPFYKGDFKCSSFKFPIINCPFNSYSI